MFLEMITNMRECNLFNVYVSTKSNEDSSA